MQKIKVLFISFFFLYNLFAIEIDFIEHNIINNFFQVNTVFPADLNKDGYDDIIACGTATNGEVSWWENQDGILFIRHPISENFNARNVMAVDINDDEELDIVACSVWLNTIKIWINDGDEEFLQEIILDDQFAGAHTIDVKDVDGDGLLDVLCAGFDTYEDDGEIAWWKNNGDLDFSEKNLISDYFEHATFVFGAYINNDEHLDVLACGENLGAVLWWENLGEGSFTQHMVDSTFSYSHTVFARDLDQDNDMDILGAACLSSQFAWWENDGNENFSKHIVGNDAGALWLDTYDLDNDGDLDLLGAAQGLSSPVWYENNGEEEFTRYQLPGSCAGGFCAIAADFDNDGDKDVSCAGWNSGKITWWESLLYEVDFEAAPLTGHFPLQVNFQDTSNLPDQTISWSWDFDHDGIIDSSEQHPSWIYTQAGDYSVSLTVETQFASICKVKENHISVFNGHSAIRYNGISSYVYCNAEEELNVSGSFTFEAWINPGCWLGNFNRILEKGGISLSISEDFPLFNENCLILQMEHQNGSISRSYTADNTIQLNQWQHVAVTYDCIDEVVFYINGICFMPEYNGIPAGNISDNSADNLVFGNSTVGNLTFEGIIDEVRIWNQVLNEQEITANMFYYLDGDENGLSACWSFNEGNGDTFGSITPNISPGLILDAQWVQGIELVQTDIETSIIPPISKAQMRIFPNPFNPFANLSFSIPVNTRVIIDIFNIKGERIIRLCDENYQRGGHELIWNASKSCSGVYFARMITEIGTLSNKMILLK